MQLETNRMDYSTSIISHADYTSFFFFCPLLAILSPKHISACRLVLIKENIEIGITPLSVSLVWPNGNVSGHLNEVFPIIGKQESQDYKNDSADSFCILSQWALCSSCFLQLSGYCLNEILHKVWLWHFHQELRFKYLNIHGKVYLLVAVTGCYFFKHIFMWFISKCRDVFSVPVAQWLEHCISSAKGRGFNSQGTHILTKNL